MFQFAWFPRDALFYLRTRTWACPHVDFSIRTSPAQTAAHTYPELFVVYHVLLRHLTPRHSPCALVASPNFRCGEVRSLALQLLSLYFLAMHLLKSCRANVVHPCRLHSSPPPEFSPGEAIHALYSSTWLPSAAENSRPTDLKSIWLTTIDTTTRDKNDPTSVGSRTVRHPYVF
jgi:hypothetical protein